MKPETMIYCIVRNIIPVNSSKTVFFVGLTDTSQEVYFYAFINNKPVQCFSLAEEYKLDENELAVEFEEITRIIRESKLYVPGQYNVNTIIVSRAGINLHTEYYSMKDSEYNIKKAWKKKYIDNIQNA